tara:strand:+ start:3564 stop:4547 length:984 start_codon:yes stop_codon:yes gene_type:complete
MKRLTKIQILLASYNGEKYIAAQIDSIRSHNSLELSVLIRDDGSTDQTTEVVEGLIDHDLDLDIQLYNNISSEKGHCKNFSTLCDIATKGDANYFCFSDQDDVWAENKIDILHTRMIAMEAIHGSDTPILIHSDLSVVDENLKEIAPSFIQYQGLPNPQSHDFPKFLYQNVVTGCTCMFNKALLELASPLPQEVLVHDWWFALCAQYFGVIDFVNQPLVKYRQHGSNAIGAISGKRKYNFLKPDIYLALLRFPKHISKSIEQAKILNKLVNERGGNEQAAHAQCINDFSLLKQKNILSRIAFVHKYIKGNHPTIALIYFYLVFVFFL